MLLGRGPAEPKRLGAGSGDGFGPPRRCSRGVWPTPVSLGGEILKCSAAARRGKAWGQATSCPRCGHSCYNSGVWLPGSCCAFGEPGPCQRRCRRMPPKGKGKGKRVKQQKRRSAAGEFGVLPALRQQGCDPRIPAMLRRRRRRQQGPAPGTRCTSRTWVGSFKVPGPGFHRPLRGEECPEWGLGRVPKAPCTKELGCCTVFPPKYQPMVPREGATSAGKLLGVKPAAPCLGVCQNAALAPAFQLQVCPGQAFPGRASRGSCPRATCEPSVSPG